MSGDSRRELSARLMLSTTICRGMPVGVRSASEPPAGPRTAAEARLGGGAVSMLGGSSVVFALLVGGSGGGAGGGAAGAGEGSGASRVVGAGAGAVLFAAGGVSRSRQNWRQARGTMAHPGQGSARNVVQQAEASVWGVQEVSMRVVMGLQEETSAQRPAAPLTSQTVVVGATSHGPVE